MRGTRKCWFGTLSLTAFLVVGGCCLRAQTLLVDRTGGTTTIGAADAPAGMFLTDSFRPGSPGETWVIDRIRLWGIPDPRAGSGRLPGDLFESVTLRTGLWTDPPGPGEPDCGCHGLLSLSSATLQRGTLRTGNPNVTMTMTEGAWQIDIDKLSWSVPGGSRLQFGFAARSRTDPRTGKTYAWYVRAAPSPDASTWYLFNADGNPSKPFDQGKGTRMDVQVWGHRLAEISITRRAADYRVTVQGKPAFEVGRVDVATLRFAGASIRPEQVKVEDVDGDGAPDLVAVVSRAGVQKGLVACLSGSLHNGDAFSGCTTVR